ncbi:metalloendoproteinase 2-MMP-like [Cucumis melo var. makuwa]|uniref:Metalloendoproteinase 2-MMP-like n=2 Tax=Cucumis melo TaxID=3656 RepID=A0A5D3BMC5_CUCMM|nr:metalloendoproteinase 2-MMP-like [Cucumis melo]KAA0037435.1 metalloendoproteinase 2-MMP-like [Cucumis melo var. makuwa]TYK00225.1 metalloendoproteinase 2-MMP-like [Cucumis melo var. makuwa]
MTFEKLLSFLTTSFFLVIVLFPLISSSHPNIHHSNGLAFLKNLNGCRKGDKVAGIHQIKEYLQHFGYLNNYLQNYSKSFDDDEFDGVLESAIKTYQLNYNLKATGTLDAKTLDLMSKPRCGVADIIDGKTRMKSGKKMVNQHRKINGHFHTVSHYAFFDGNPKWPASKSHLTYGFLPGTPSKAVAPVGRAFKTWGAHTHFNFSRASKYKKADIKISFRSGDHGDGHSFDGVGGVIAHGFAPTDGRLHFDAIESWAVGAVADSFDLETVALHEIGHLLGLHHSSVEGAIMWPSIMEGTTKGLDADDIAGINALYNAN